MKIETKYDKGQEVYVLPFNLGKARVVPRVISGCQINLTPGGSVGIIYYFNDCRYGLVEAAIYATSEEAQQECDKRNEEATNGKQ